MDEQQLRSWLEKRLAKQGKQLLPPLWDRLKDTVEGVLWGGDKIDDLLDAARYELDYIAEMQQVHPAAARPKVHTDAPPVERLRERAQSLCWARQASEIKGVHSWRQRHLPGGSLLSTEQAHDFCVSPATGFLSLGEFRRLGVPLVAHRAEVGRMPSQWYMGKGPVRKGTVSLRIRWEGGKVTLRRQVMRRQLRLLGYQPPPPNDHPLSFPDLMIPGDPEYRAITGDENLARMIDFADGSVLASLWDLTNHLRVRCPWRYPAHATWYVLTGEIPPVSLLEWWPERVGSSSRLILSVQPWATANTVLRAYQMAQRELIGHPARPLRERALCLAAFVAEHRLEDPTVSWESLRREWNAAHPQWCYDGPAGLQSMMRDENRTRTALLNSPTPTHFHRTPYQQPREAEGAAK